MAPQPGAAAATPAPALPQATAQRVDASTHTANSLDADAAAAAAAVAASSAACWAVKGEGNANVVLAYAGADPALVGRVLRLRKLPKHHQRTQQQQQHASAGRHETAAAPEAAAPTTAAALAALEARIWQPMIPDWHRLDAMQRELAFVQNVLAPHFTAAADATSSSSPTNSSSSSAPAACQLAVAAAAQVEAPPGLLRALQQRGHNLAPGVSGLLMHDASLLAPGQLPPGWAPLGPCLCVEVKPKSGAALHPVGAAAAVPAGSLKWAHPRFVLHQLLKHAQGKAPLLSYYDPQDLFLTGTQSCHSSSSSISGSRGCACGQGLPHSASASDVSGCDQHGKAGQQQQQQRWLSGSPSKQHKEQQQGVPGTTVQQQQGQQQQQQLRQQAALLALLERPSNNLKLFVDGHKLPAPAVSAAAAQHTLPETTAAGEAEPARRSGSTSSTRTATAAEPGPAAASACGDQPSTQLQQRLARLGGLLQQLPPDCLQLASGQQQQQERPRVEQQAQPVPHPTQQAAAAAAGDAGGRERLLCRVLCGVLSTSRVLPRLLSLQQLDTLDVAGTHALFLEALQLQGEGDGSAQQQASSKEEQLARLRDYLTAATAKDCALMVTLQQVVRLPQQLQEGASDAAPAASGTCARPACAAHVYEDATSGACFAWQLSLVDLDLKPLAKLPLHWQLDCEIVAAAEARRGVLVQHAADSAAWRVAAVEHLQQQQQ